jgi:hypothetical protein
MKDELIKQYSKKEGECQEKLLWPLGWERNIVSPYPCWYEWRLDIVRASFENFISKANLFHFR